MTDQKLAAEVVKLKQEVAELRTAICGLEKVVNTLVLSDSDNLRCYNPTLKPIEIIIPK